MKKDRVKQLTILIIKLSFSKLNKYLKYPIKSYVLANSLKN
ncbi:Uncharacterised protein [Serratia fonticola]|uniref:Uncharacterized protein n=1 Tax=Serratia fonticola TaxID=47917 RepID=A0A4U9TKV2_SERFO|nr:Uncharacterised protein [Serratia fonticola]VTR19249.1 Uncharacterised protein [Serratia fonticola]